MNVFGQCSFSLIVFLQEELFLQLEYLEERTRDEMTSLKDYGYYTHDRFKLRQVKEGFQINHLSILTEDMARFVDNYPEYKKMQRNVSKHVTLVTEMSKIVEARNLMMVSQKEQDWACNGDQGAAYEVVNICDEYLLAPFSHCPMGSQVKMSMCLKEHQILYKTCSNPEEIETIFTFNQLRRDNY